MKIVGGGRLNFELKEFRMQKVIAHIRDSVRQCLTGIHPGTSDIFFGLNVIRNYIETRLQQELINNTIEQYSDVEVSTGVDGNTQVSFNFQPVYSLNYIQMKVSLDDIEVGDDWTFEF